ncbi:PbsX family transcriptional regulator [Escherichia coli]|nr:PbsX family transcriptional regulator [Escherichia coli]
MEQHSNRFIHTHYEYRLKLPLNNISDKQFWLLVELSGIRSDKIIISLREHLVDGFSKLEACERNNVALSYFSVSVKKLRRIHNIVALISEYYTGG